MGASSDTDVVKGNGGATYGPVSTFPTMPSPPSLPSATAGSTNVTLNSGQSQTLAGGSYGRVTANSNATLTLAGGTYVFSSLTLNSGATMAVSGATTLSVTGTFNVGSNSYAGPASGSGLTAKSLVLYLGTSTGINLNSGATIQALMVAPNAKVTVDTSQFTGALAAAQVLMNSGGTVTYQDGLGSLVGGGGTNLCTGVTCTALDACHEVGVCNPSTGVCSNPNAPDGTGCSDGNACTQTDTCSGGTCVGSNPVVCTAAGQCSAVGTCDPSTGVCSNPNAPDGTSCNDGSACTQTDTCSGGACVGSNPVVCTAAGQCSAAGTCDPSTGVCSNPNAPDGTACSDGSACTQTDQCLAGVCIGSNPVVCASAGQCLLAGACDPSSGACSSPPAPNGSSCSDGDACTVGDACQSGSCVSGTPVTCTASDACHGVGSCDSSTGACSNPPLPNGTSCSSGNACVSAGSCESGTCNPGQPVTCVASDSCHLQGTCTSGDGGVGGCSNPVAPAGTACSVGACGGSCSAAGSCQAEPYATNACVTTTCTADGGFAVGTNTCVPTLNGTVATNIASMVSGPAINPAQVALVRGRVLGLPQATPLAGVTVSVLAHPEYTPSVTGADGTYAVAVNGGAQVTLNYAGPSAANYLSVQRHTPSRWQQYAVVPDVYLTPLDPNATDITLSDATWQSAAGSTITDPADETGLDGGPPVSASGPHTARLFFPANTTGNFTYGACGAGNTCAQGSCSAGTCVGPAPGALTVRITEYTVGATGRSAMPAELPPATAYTYAVEFTVDEAVAAGAGGVAFNQPVSFYVDDFLGYGPAQAGTANPVVPVASLDRTSGTWTPKPNGAIVEITGFTGTCPGSGCVATVREPTVDGGVIVSLSADELAFLGQTYGGAAAPKYLWRFTTPELCGWDANWPMEEPDGGTGPTNLPMCTGPSCPDPNACDSMGGSIIECQNAILAQQIAVPGTPYFLRYQSERAPGRAPTIAIPLTGSTWPPATMPVRIDVEVDIAGQSNVTSYDPTTLTPNDVVMWSWNRQDVFGNTVQGVQAAEVSISYVFKAVPVAPQVLASDIAAAGGASDAVISFDQFTTSGTPIVATPIRALGQIALSTTTTVRVGVEDPAPLGLGGWTLSPQHVYDPNSYTFWGGDGTRRTLTPGASVIQDVPGETGVRSVPIVAPNGTLYEAYDERLYRISSTGSQTLVAGGGSTYGNYAAGTPALSVAIASNIESLAISASGLIYEGNGGQLNVIDPVAGTIQTLAGQELSNGNYVTGCEDAPVATQGTMYSVNGLAVAPDGSVYLVDVSCQMLRKVGTDGALRTVSAPLGCTHTLNWAAGQLVGTACLEEPNVVAVGPDGTLFVADNQSFPRVSRVDAQTGVISTYAGALPSTPGLPAGGALQTPFAYDGVLATRMQFAGDVEGLAVDPNGVVYADDYTANSVYAIDPNHVVHLVAGGQSELVLQQQNATGSEAHEANNVPAVGALVWQPNSIAIDPNGSILVADDGYTVGVSNYPLGGMARIRAIVPAFPSFSLGTTLVPSADGTELYQFQPFGQHIATLDPVTGATRRTFQYDSQSRLTSITETTGGTTTLAYNGATVTITPPFSAGGQQTTLTLDAAGGHATTITTPAGETTQASYDNGLMTSLIDPRSGLHAYTYNDLGYLTVDTDPASAVIGLATTLDTTPESPDGGLAPFASWQTAVTSATGHVTTHQDFTLTNASIERNILAPSGAKRLSTESSGELWTSTAADGTTTSTQLAPDPQFGMLDSYPGTTTRTTPSGLAYSSVRTRASTGNAVGPSSITDLTTINGQAESWSSVFTAAGSAPAHWLFTSPAGRQRMQQLDSLGRVSSVSFPDTKTLPTTSYVYDADGRIASVTVTPGANGGGAARVTSNTYDIYLAGYLASTTDPNGDVTTYDQRDQDGRVLDVELPDFGSQPASHVATTYDPNGNVTSVTVPPATSLPSTHTFTSTPVDLLASYTPPQVSTTRGGDDPELATLTTSYAYNGDRLVTAVDAPEGTSYAAVTTTYDNYGRLGATFDPLSNVTATYGYVLNGSGVSTDQVGNIVTSDGVSVTNTFDGFLKKKTQWSSSSVAGSVNWSYDSFFRPSTLQVSSAPAITFAYDLDSLYAGTSSPVFTVTRDQSGSSLDGLPYASTLGTVSDAWTYDGFGAQSSYTVKTSDGTIQYAMYGSGGIGSPISRDALGRITAMNEQINGVTHSWLMTYDVRGRLESVTLDGNTSVYGYDPNGNVVTINDGTFGTYDAQDRMVTFTPPGGSTWTLSYTNNGDLTYKTNGVQDYAFDYDLSSNLRSVQVNTSISAGISYVIDGSNRRIGKAITPSTGSSVSDGLLYDEQNRVVGDAPNPVELVK